MHTLTSSRHLIRSRQNDPLPLLSLLPHFHHARIPRPQAPGHHYSKEGALSRQMLPRHESKAQSRAISMALAGS
jgi:hypothetical protein